MTAAVTRLSSLLCLAKGYKDHGPAFGLFVQIGFDRADDVFLVIKTATVNNFHDALAGLRDEFLRIFRRNKAARDDLRAVKKTSIALVNADVDQENAAARKLFPFPHDN